MRPHVYTIHLHFITRSCDLQLSLNVAKKARSHKAHHWFHLRYSTISRNFKVRALCKLFQTGYSFIKWVESNAVLDYPSIRLSLESFNWGEHGLVIWYFCTILFYPHLLNLISFHFIINTEYVQACSICLSNRAPKLGGWFWGLYT